MNENDSYKEITPFSLNYTPQIPELLWKLKCSIMLSTHQCGKVVFISPKDEEFLVQLPRSFDKPMGIAENAATDQIALATKSEVIVFSNSQDLAASYPKFPDKYDALYMPRATYYSGYIDIHDLCFGREKKLFAVNTLFSCIITIDDTYNFVPYWQPPFIDRLVSEDRCHLNGLALEDGLPKYVTAFNEKNTMKSWRNDLTKNGVVIDVTSNETICRGLQVPHSPIMVNGQLYLLLSATGEVIKVNVDDGTYDVVTQIDGFVRGISFYKGYLFVGLSKLRKNSSIFASEEFVDKSNSAGIEIIHLETGSKVGRLSYETTVDEIYDVHVLSDKLRPNILNTMQDDHTKSLMIPDGTFWMKEIPKE